MVFICRVTRCASGGFLCRVCGGGWDVVGEGLHDVRGGVSLHSVAGLGGHFCWGVVGVLGGV